VFLRFIEPDTGETDHFDLTAEQAAAVRARDDLFVRCTDRDCAGPDDECYHQRAFVPWSLAARFVGIDEPTPHTLVLTAADRSAILDAVRAAGDNENAFADLRDHLLRSERPGLAPLDAPGELAFALTDLLAWRVAEWLQYETEAAAALPAGLIRKLRAVADAVAGTA
jgi:hypothetical protein